MHPLPIYRTTSKTSRKLMRYRHVPKLFQALSVYGLASNLLTGSFIMAGLWTLPGLLALQIASNISANAKAIVKSVNLLPFGMIVEVENLEGGRKQYAIKHLRAPSEREVEAIIRGGQEAAEAMIKANTPIIVEPKAGLIVELLYIDEKNNEFNDDAVKQEMLGCVVKGIEVRFAVKE
ncbi:hypothetical protein FGO68_gene1619 [Halteria grandinella]|uniref:Uncharacterized protein n=1 Tax=Halteria grandinella TaxID=5974 RepID=A0A8J8NVW6_HALGN|nr:hypothetical protein FGO68_gene1619 [Halteria grandinella]